MSMCKEALNIELNSQIGSQRKNLRTTLISKEVREVVEPDNDS